MLRGVNVGGHNKLPMKDLRTRLSDGGFVNVRTYLQSGNVAFEADPDDADGLAERVSSVIRAGFGLDVITIVRDREAMSAAVAANPYRAAADADPTRVHVMFGDDLPTDGAGAWPAPDSFAPDSYSRGPGCIFLHLPNGAARTKLPAALERAVAVPVTSRNWRTVGRLAEMLG